MIPASTAVVGALTGLAIAAFVGLAIGVIASLLKVGRHPAGWGTTLLLGIAGAWVGSFLLAAFDTGPTLPGLAGAALGAALLLSTFQLLRRGRRPSKTAGAPGRPRSVDPQRSVRAAR